MRQTIYLYEPEPIENVEYFNERNVGLAKFLAEMTGRDYGGEYVLRAENAVPKNAYWFLHGPVTPKEAEKLGINKVNYYGGVTDFLHAQKSVFHIPIPDASYVPVNFPLNFVDFLRKEDVLLPGYTVFAKKDAKIAYRLLSDQGYIVRVKDPIQSTMKGQYRISSEEELDAVLKTLSNDSILKYGLVLEVNMVSGSEKDLDSTSAGWYDIDDTTYYYVGFMNFEETITPFSYVGTDMFTVRKKDKSLLSEFQNGQYADEYKMLNVFQEANRLLEGFRATRCNYNFIRGYLETKDGHETSEKVFATEPTYRPGGATAAEFLAKQYLDEHTDEKMVHARTRFHYGPKEDIDINANYFMVHDGKYEGTGRNGTTISTPVQVYAEIMTK